MYLSTSNIRGVNYLKRWLNYRKRFLKISLRYSTLFALVQLYNYFRRVAIILINFQIGTGFREVMNEVFTSDNPIRDYDGGIKKRYTG